MEKEKFENWNKLKQEINSLKRGDFYIKEGQVWMVNQGENIGFESNGKGIKSKRAVLVLKKNGNLFVTLAMTTKGKDKNRFYYNLDESYFGKKSSVILSQLKVLDKKRFIEELGKISGEDLRNIKSIIKKSFL